MGTACYDVACAFGVAEARTSHIFVATSVRVGRTVPSSLHED